MRKPSLFFPKGILFLTFLLGYFPILLEGAHYKVFLLGGQSNALGRAPSSELPTSPVNLQVPQDDVLFYFGSTLTTLRPGSGRETTEFGLEVSFGRAVADAFPTDNIAIIKYAAGATTLYNHWAPGSGPHYTAFRNTVTAGLAAIQAAGHTTEIIGMLWHQGESDAIDGQQAAYQTNLTAFITDIRNRYGADLPFLIGEIRRSNGPAFVKVADAQIAVAAADSNAVFVPASDLSFLDIYHFDAPSQITLGKRFSSAYISLNTPETSWITGVSIEEVSSIFAAARSADNIINGTGFTEATGYHSSASGDNISWTSASSAENPLGHFLTFDLGANHDLSSVKIWNWNVSNTLNAGSKDISISVASEVGGSFTPLNDFVLTIGTGQDSVDFGQEIELSGFTAANDVRLVKIDIHSNHGWTNASVPGLAGLSEIRFSGTSLPINTFATWINDSAFGLPFEDRGFGDDSDGDGIANGVENFFGTHPGEFSQGLMAGSRSGNSFVFTHPQNATPASDLTPAYRWSTNLIDWFVGDNIDGPGGGLTVDIGAAPVGPSTTTVTATASQNLPKLFLRVEVTSN